jgi:hypothetical protein
MVITDRLMAGVYPSFPAAVSTIVQSEGLRGFYTGTSLLLMCIHAVLFVYNSIPAILELRLVAGFGTENPLVWPYVDVLPAAQAAALRNGEAQP